MSGRPVSFSLDAVSLIDACWKKERQVPIAIVGNGVLGSLAAVLAKAEMPKEDVYLFGPKSRSFSASVAAGAMANVYAEYESLPDSQTRNQELALALGVRGSAGWRTLLSETNSEEIITAQDTLVFLKNLASEFEARNFWAMVSRAKSDNKGEFEHSTGWSHPLLQSKMVEAIFRIRGEFAIDSEGLFKLLDTLMQELGVVCDSKLVEMIQPENGLLRFCDGSEFSAGTVLVAAGAHSSGLFQAGQVMQTFQGAGIALLVSRQSLGLREPIREVIRTVNRGGAQCGVHLVPRSNGALYIGAGNQSMPAGPVPMRFETIRYLLGAAETEFFGKSGGYNFAGDILRGSRPRSLDGMPMIGPVGEFGRVYIITATNRVGLTWAPALVKDWMAWVSSGELADYCADWSPAREPSQFADEDESVEYFASSRAAAAREHGLIGNNRDEYTEKMAEMRTVGRDLRNRLPSHLQGISPDNWLVAAE